MQTLYGPPLRCDPAHSPGCCAAWRFPLAFTLLRFTLPLHSPPWQLSGYWGPSGLPRWTQGSHLRAGARGMRSCVTQKIRWFWRHCSKRCSPPKSKNDVCYRDRCFCVPTCAAAQLGLHVFARHSEQHFWCVQSRIGHFFSGHAHLQAHRSWSERQLSQQLLPAEEWGIIHVMSYRANYQLFA